MSIRPLIFLLIYMGITHPITYAQQLRTSDLVDAWHVKNNTQTQRAEYTYADLLTHINADAFSAKLDSLHDYLQNHPDPRIRIRTLIYTVLGHRMLDSRYVPLNIADVKQAITLAGLEKDPQLESELYTFYADNYINGPLQDRLFYNLKALEIQRHIGFKYFPHVYLRFVSLSKALYDIMDYRQTIHYGLQCLALMKTPDTNIKCFVLQLDLIGASYRRLGMADSTAYYYQQISRVIENYLPPDDSFKQIWTGIAAGGRAQALFLNKDYHKASALLWQNLDSSLVYKQWSDASLAANALAKIHYIGHDLDSALDYHSRAFQWARQSGDLINTIEAARALATIYRKRQQADSAYLYTDRYHLYRDSLQEKMNSCRLATLKSQLDYDDMQATLDAAEKTINKQIQLRNIILASILLMAVLALWLYNRYRLKQNHRRQLLERQNQIAALEVKQAKEQIDNFATNIKQKDQLIGQLEQKLQTDVSRTPLIAFTDAHLRQYTLITDEQWAKFKGEFMKAYPHFYPGLYAQLHKMTPAEERLTALIYLRLSNQQIAGTLGISKESVARSKRRLNQRIMLPPDSSLENYLLTTKVSD